MMNKLLIAIATAFLTLGTAYAEPSISVDNVKQKLSTVKGDLNTYLGNFVDACTKKQWAACHVAWYELHENGLQYVVEHEAGFEYGKWMFIKNKTASDIYDFVIDGLGHKNNIDGWDLGVSVERPYKGVVSYVPARYALFDPGARLALLELVQANLGTYAISYNTNNTMVLPKAEWYRILVLAFMSRKDVNNTYYMLDTLKKYGKIKNSTAGYNELLNAVQDYFKKTGVLK